MININYVKGDLFTAPADCWLVHCISADFKMGAGIAKEFTKRGAKRSLKEVFGNYKWQGVGACLPIVDSCGHRGVFNLVTKERYYYKPTYNTLAEALQDLVDLSDVPVLLPALREGEIKLAMPKIGCGLDRLEWPKVEHIIKDILDEERFKVFVYEIN